MRRLILNIGLILMWPVEKYWKLTRHEFTYGVRKKRIEEPDTENRVVYFDKVMEKGKV